MTHKDTKLLIVDDYYMDGVKQLERRFRDTQSKLYELTKEFNQLNDELAKQKQINKEISSDKTEISFENECLKDDVQMLSYELEY
eukprot:COSAG05_NODE_23867_length_255_cov_0.660256_1_plen_84_part_11